MYISNDEKIDVVILWVDGNDEKWLNEKNKYSNIEGNKSINRFRDCDNLQFLFRGIENYMPWVNNIFFITCEQVPKWLNVNHPKLKLVNHKDYIPEKYLPTFNSNVIEMNLHRIKDLSEKFILFNDDIFVIDNIDKEFFFKNGLPTDIYCETIIIPHVYNDTYYFMLANSIAILNKHFQKETFIKNNLDKVYNPLYEDYNDITRKITNSKNKFTGFKELHSAQPYLKSTFKEIWSKEETALNKACYNKFRKASDISHNLCRYWQLASGNFIPKRNETKYYTYLDDNTITTKEITQRKYKIVCINDVYMDIDFERAKQEINQALNNILPYKCSFEL